MTCIFVAAANKFVCKLKVFLKSFLLSVSTVCLYGKIPKSYILQIRFMYLGSVNIWKFFIPTCRCTFSSTSVIFTTYRERTALHQHLSTVVEGGKG